MSLEFLEDRLKNWIIDLKHASSTLKAEIYLMKKVCKHHHLIPIPPFSIFLTISDLKLANNPESIQLKIEASLLILRKKIKSKVRKLKSYLAFNCKTVRDKEDPLTFMTRLKKKVDDLLDDTETFMTSLHQTNPFVSNQPLRRASVQYAKFAGINSSGQFKYRSVRGIGGSGKKRRRKNRSKSRSNRKAKRSNSKNRQGYLKDTFNSKYQRHINEI
jgi:hypothetical protein